MIFNILDFGATKFLPAAACLYQPRIYPTKFADAIVKLREPLLNSRVTRLDPMDLPLGHHTVLSMPDDDNGLFAAADLRSVFHYLRCGKGLNVPRHWQDVVPKPDMSKF